MRPPRVVMLGPAPDARGGIASVVTAYRDTGLLARWGVSVIATHADASTLSKLGVATRALLRFAPQVLSHQIDLVHVHVASDASFWRKLPFCALTRLAAVPLIVHVHGGGFAAFHAQGGPVRRAAIAWMLRHATAVAALSPRWAARLAPLAGATPITVLPNPLPAQATAPAAPRRASALQVAAPQLVFLGLLCEAKGVFDLLDAFVDVLRRHPHARLVLAGNGDVAGAQQRAQALGIAANVDTPGWVHGPAKADLLAGATVFVLPSHAEGVPMSILEAQNLGVAVLATDVGGVPDIVDHGVHGWLVPPQQPLALAEGINRLLDDPALRARLAASGCARARSESLSEVVMARVEGLYAQLLGQVAAAALPVTVAQTSHRPTSG
jgi:glycosyltransferase involved in cell wall biosynthesis